MKSKIIFVYLIQVFVFVIVFFCLFYFIQGGEFKEVLIEIIFYLSFTIVGTSLWHKLYFRFKKPDLYQIKEEETVYVEEEVIMLFNFYLQKVKLQVTNQNLIWTYSKQSKVHALTDLKDVRVKKGTINFYFKHQKIGFFTENAQAILDTLEIERQNSNLSCT